MRSICSAIGIESCARGFLCLLLLTGLTSSASAQIPQPNLAIRKPSSSNGWVQLNSSFRSNAVLMLEGSTNLAAWEAIGTFHDGVINYPDVATPAFAQRFYRLRAASRVATNDWKNQLLFPNEPFRSPGGEPFQPPVGHEIRWVKFAILLNDLTRVFYQDSTKYAFHYDFAAARLPGFLGIDPNVFDGLSLHRANQEVVLGAVLYPANPTYVEYGVQFVGLDPYPPEDISRWFQLVRATIYATNGAGAYYMPVFEQNEMARTNADAFAALVVAVSSVERWVLVNNVYSQGWVLGRLKYFPGTEIAAASADGRLRPEDILLTDGVPAETPLVAGIISLTPSTPNSHTAILCESFGIPFAYISDATEQARLQQLVGHKIILRTSIPLFSAQRIPIAKVLDVEGILSPALEAELLALKQPQPIQYSPKNSFGSISASTDTLNPSDIQYFGGKAANYGILRNSIPTNCPPAIAFSFDLWDGFLDQILSGGQTLRAEINSRIAPYTNYPPDIPSLKTNLAAIRDLITKTAGFTASQKQAITNALTIFNPKRKIRFRSSTNVEDSESFTGAGLYDSFSGCLCDDQDGDTAGPSLCDSTEPNERGVFRAIQKVYASFYNDNAVLERLHHSVDESQVGMGVLVHHSFPDEGELANGVATLGIGNFAAGTNFSGQLVTQLGAESVTNPDGTSMPEVVDLFGSGFSQTLTLTRGSSLVPLGGYVMDWQNDYRAFINLFVAVADGFHQFYPARSGFSLDFEYKKDANLGLVVKQVRQIPPASSTNWVTAFLIDEPTRYRIRQGEGIDAFAVHRLKSLWTLHTASIRMTSSNLAQNAYGEATVEFISNGTLQALGGAMNTWPNASNLLAGGSYPLNYWTTGTGTNQRKWELQSIFYATSVNAAEPPIFTQRDFNKSLHVTYARPMPTLTLNPSYGPTTTNEYAGLEVDQELMPGALLQQRAYATNGVRIDTSFYWPPTPALAAEYTAPLAQFVQTRITGLTTNAIVLTNYYSQTYVPYHHNRTEAFIFEPRLQPGLPPSILAELNAKNIQLIHVIKLMGTDAPFFRILGLDETFRPLQ